MSTTKNTINILPVTFEADGCLVHLLEVLKAELFGKKMFHAAVRIECDGLKTKVFTIDARSNEELKAKILVEISKLKLIRFLYGDTFTQEVIG